ncbi:hypothetical protein SRABI128_05803 [Microbacterium sp. Bi128]|nr:hypothetical protein SRABI128_05803 [Microbacterium sp. Bi128]
MPGPWAFQIAPSEPGKPAAMDVKISRDMPLPTPFSVTSSPIHMIRPVPAVSVMMIRTVVTIELSGMMGSWQLGSSWPERASDTSVVALSRPSAIVR